MPGPFVLGGIAAGSALLNMLAGHAEAGRREQLRKQLMELFSSSNLSNETNSLFDLLRSSPMYTGLRTRAMEGANTLAGQLQTSFARSGLSRSGIAATALPIARSSFTSDFQNIDADLFMKALSQARDLISSRASALTGTAGPSGTQLGIGNTLQSIMPLMLQYFGGQPSGSSMHSNLLNRPSTASLWPRY